MTIFKNNTTEYTIIYPDKAKEAEKNAADNISKYVYKVSGVKIPVKQSRFVVYDKNAKIVSVGNTSALEKSGVSADYSALKGDGFIIKSVGNGIFINGSTARGTLYGAYEFIEKYLGVKFLTLRVYPENRQMRNRKPRYRRSSRFPLPQLYDRRLQQR